MDAETQDRGPVGALEKVRQHVRILGDLTRLSAGAVDLDIFLDQAVAQVARAVEIGHAKILRYRPEMGDFIVQAGVGWKPGVVHTATLSADLSSAPGRAFQIAEPVIVTEFAIQHEYTQSPFLKQHGIVAVANAPIMIGNAAWGVLEVDSVVPRDFSEDTSEFLVSAGATIGNCISKLTSGPGQAERLAAAMLEAQHRQVLLRELQHRIKNSFQLLLAAITLQKRRFDNNADVNRALNNVAERIGAISLAHDQLQPRQTGQVVKLPDYLRALCASLRQQSEGIEIDIEADEIELAIDRAVALGLILNEAATNSIKYAYGDDGGRIAVKLASGVGYDEARLTVTDSGVGFSEHAPRGSGLTLMEALARRIGARLERKNTNPGTMIAVQFPIIR